MCAPVSGRPSVLLPVVLPPDVPPDDVVAAGDDDDDVCACTVTGAFATLVVPPASVTTIEWEPESRLDGIVAFRVNAPDAFVVTEPSLIGVEWM